MTNTDVKLEKEKIREAFRLAAIQASREIGDMFTKLSCFYSNWDNIDYNMKLWKETEEVTKNRKPRFGYRKST